MISYTATLDTTLKDTAQLVLKDVFKVFPGRQSLVDRILRRTSPDYIAIAEINLEIPANTFVSIIGPSGCGKSTLLNIIAGLTAPTSGAVMLNGTEIYHPGPDRGVVFQNYSLMPWMTVAENIRFAIETVYPKMSRDRQKQDRARIYRFSRVAGCRTQTSPRTIGRNEAKSWYCKGFGN